MVQWLEGALVGWITLIIRINQEMPCAVSDPSGMGRNRMIDNTTAHQCKVAMQSIEVLVLKGNIERMMGQLWTARVHI